MKLDKIREELKHLQQKHICLLDLMIYDETTCQLEEDLTDEELTSLMGYVENAYLKADNLDLYNIVKYCIKNRDKLENMGTWEIVDGACQESW